MQHTNNYGEAMAMTEHLLSMQSVPGLGSLAGVVGEKGFDPRYWMVLASLSKY